MLLSTAMPSGTSSLRAMTTVAALTDETGHSAGLNVAEQNLVIQDCEVIGGAQAIRHAQTWGGTTVTSWQHVRSN